MKTGLKGYHKGVPKTNAGEKGQYVSDSSHEVMENKVETDIGTTQRRSLVIESNADDSDHEEIKESCGMK